MKCYSTSQKILMVLGLSAAIFLFGVAFSYTAHAESIRDITVQWDAVDATDLDVYQVRMNADNATMIDVGAIATVWAGTLTLLDDQNTFEVRARDLGGQVGPWSDPAYHDPVPGQPQITVIVIRAD